MKQIHFGFCLCHTTPSNIEILNLENVHKAKSLSHIERKMTAATPMVFTDPKETKPPKDVIAMRYPLVAKHSCNYAAKLIQKSWSRYMMRVVYTYLLQCSREFEATLNPKELSRIYPEFLESSDPRMTARLRIRMQGESFPPCLVCRIIAESAPSVDGGKHAPKWIPLFNAGTIVPVDQKALVHIFLEAIHYQREAQKSSTRNNNKTATTTKK
ncbi:hypothetical protein TRFO_27292 [Tritrichomonas foetus]|uniref:Uncharacterized protein n=1 Tax=Tritrichomonas foetus TaxID=1144522 RepID=A0A1J4K153_9EUKA|nr:hypothetical protein TRFO_27292 [Tritrichomonas foetus]|eukprot:OHT05111.1 hypothetical protein TRFO_27292 [Tritrichomonas foetus]